MSKQKYKSKFQDEWLVNSKYKDWIRKVEKDVHSAYCSYYIKEISMAGQGSKALDGQATSQKHLKIIPIQPPLTFPTIVKSVNFIHGLQTIQRAETTVYKCKAGHPKIGDNVVY